MDAIVVFFIVIGAVFVCLYFFTRSELYDFACDNPMTNSYEDEVSEQSVYSYEDEYLDEKELEFCRAAHVSLKLNMMQTDALRQMNEAAKKHKI